MRPDAEVKKGYLYPKPEDVRKSIDGLPLHRFEKVLDRHGIDIPSQTLAR